MRLFLLVLTVSTAALAGCTTDADPTLIQLLPTEQDLTGWVYLEREVPGASALLDAHGIVINPGNATPAAFVGRRGLEPAAAAGAMFSKVGGQASQTLQIFALEFGSKANVESYLGQTAYCSRSDDFRIYGDQSGKLVFAYAENLGQDKAVLGELEASLTTRGLHPACD